MTYDVSLSCYQTWGNSTLQQCRLKSFAFGCWLENNSVNIVFLRILSPIDWRVCSRHTAQLPLMSIIFRADMSFYDMSGLGGLAIFKCLAHFPGTCPRFSLMATTHNSTALKVNDMTRHFICNSFWSKNFCMRWPDTQKNPNIHAFLIDVIVIFSQVLGPIHRFHFRNEPCLLPLMSVIFSTARVSYNISGLFVIFKCLTHFPGTCPGVFIDGHNVQRGSSF